MRDVLQYFDLISKIIELSPAVKQNRNLINLIICPARSRARSTLPTARGWSSRKGS